MAQDFCKVMYITLGASDEYIYSMQQVLSANKFTLVYSKWLINNLKSRFPMSTRILRQLLLLVYLFI